jgi:hypothetical protein
MLDRALAQLTEIAGRDRRAAEAQGRLEQALHSLAEAEGEEYVELAGYVLCVHPDGDATVLAPAGRTVSVRSLPEDPGSATGIRPGGIAKTSVAIDLAALGKQPAVLIVDEAGS